MNVMIRFAILVMFVVTICLSGGCGPFGEKKSVYPAGNLLVDFKDIALGKRVSGSLPDIQDKSSEEQADIPRTRPNILTSPVVKPVPSRTEDVLTQ